MTDAASILRELGIKTPSTSSGQYNTLCPKCSAGRRREHQKAKCLRVKIDDEGVQYKCQHPHCAFAGGKRFDDAGARKIAQTYDYTDASGKLLFQTVRYRDGEPRFLQRRPNGNGDWIWNLKDTQRVLYALADIGTARDQPVIVVEGEKDADNVWKLGLPATCNPMGAGKWREEYGQFLKGADVVIIGDNDEPGRKHVEDVARKLQSYAKRVRVLDLAQHWPDIRPGNDISDWLAAGHAREDLDQLIESAPEWRPSGSGNGGDTGAPEQQAPPAETKPALVIQSSAEFVRGFVPPDYLLDGILQRRFLYSMTGRTNGGKTAVALLIAAHVAMGKSIGNLEVTQGRVLYFAGENPDDHRMRWIAMAQHLDFDREAIPVTFIPGTFKISVMAARIAQHVKQHGELALVVVDTSAAYFEGDDENSNVQQGTHARRLRSLVTLPGGPCVLALCHPVKNAAPDNLIPRGGGAYVAEVDGNLTCARDDLAVELHWQGKFRGPDFAPISFLLRTVTHETLKDSKGRLIPTVIASHLSEAGQQELAKVTRGNEDRLLCELGRNGSASLVELARTLGWHLKNGDPHKMMVKRAADALIKAKFITRERDGFALTDKGEKARRKDNYV